MSPIVRFKRLHAQAVIPSYQTPGAAGMDLHWDGRTTPNGEPGCNSLSVLGQEPAAFYTGIALELPEGYEAQIRPRSSLSKRGIQCYLGTIDSDYRGELVVLLQDTLRMHRQSAGQSTIRQGDRIAQLVIAPVARATIEEVEELSSTGRGTGGFGSTGR